MHIVRLLFVALALASAPAAAQFAAGNTVIILVRHGEKAAEPAADPPLTPAGTARADALAAALSDAGIGAVISTDFARTRNTAAPVSARLGLTTEIVDARAPDHATQVASGILSRHRGQTVLVVGHSNTIPAIVAALGAPRPLVCDGDYDNLFVVTVPASGTVSIVRARYGAPTRDATCEAAMKS